MPDTGQDAPPPHEPDDDGITRRQLVVAAGVAGVGLTTAGVVGELLSSSGSAPGSRDAFVGLSSELTGFTPLELAGTGAIDVYRGWLRRAFPGELDELLGRWPAVLKSRDRAAGLQREILDDAKLGPFARGILGLWYTATWNQLPESWAKAYGRRPEDVNRAFAASYAGGLAWSAGGLHPQGAKPTGFGIWALPPHEVSDV
jgi:hypothetical protein